MIDCNEWRTEKRHECTNMGKVKWLELWWQLYRTSLPVWDLENFRPLDFFWHECTSTPWLWWVGIYIFKLPGEEELLNVLKSAHPTRSYYRLSCLLDEALFILSFSRLIYLPATPVPLTNQLFSFSILTHVSEKRLLGASCLSACLPICLSTRPIQ